MMIPETTASDCPKYIVSAPIQHAPDTVDETIDSLVLKFDKFPQELITDVCIEADYSGYPDLCAAPTPLDNFGNSQKTEFIRNCKNCSYSFRVELIPFDKFCSKDCHTSYYWFKKKPNEVMKFISIKQRSASDGELKFQANTSGGAYLKHVSSITMNSKPFKESLLTPQVVSISSLRQTTLVANSVTDVNESTPDIRSLSEGTLSAVYVNLKTDIQGVEKILPMSPQSCRKWSSQTVIDGDKHPRENRVAHSNFLVVLNAVKRFL